MIRLVALDIDGTLLDTSNRLSEANAAAVREAVAGGVTVVLATSRWFYLARLTARELGLITPLICHNGALIKRPDDEEELLHLRLDQRFAQETATLGDERGYRMFTTVGHTGTAYPLAVLVAALEDAKPGDKIIVASYGNGSDAILLQVTDEIEKARDRRGIGKHLASKKDLNLYEKYVTFREVLAIDTGGRGDEVAPTQASILFRERRMLMGLCGSKCRKCGTAQYPPQEICANPKCGAVNEMDDYRFSDKGGRLFTYTGDVLAFTPSPPAIYGMVDFDGGGRWLFDLTDCELDAIEVGMPVEMSFRRKYHDARRGVHVYFWKATPIRA